MTVKEFAKALPALKRQVGGLKVPYLDLIAASGRDPFRVLISCILSLRTQDGTTARASERLFRLASTPLEMSVLSEQVISEAIYPVGFYRVKAQKIKKMSSEIACKLDSRVPDTIDELLKFDGVGRKTANLVVILGYGKDGICVDTHVHRITNRWGLVGTRTPEETEFALREVLPIKYWQELNGLLVAFGQGICKPISPLCSWCAIIKYCNKINVKSSR